MKILSFLLIAMIFRIGTAGAQTPSAPDYSNLINWSASPHKWDTSDSIPAFLKDEKVEKLADVFFIHPTSYFDESDTASWNAWLNDEIVNLDTDYRSILFQSSVFNGSCRVFAPRYRQANMEVFYKMGTPKADAAFDLAYNDVKAAFEYYIRHENNNRPIVIASHSQGTLHSIRLLQEFFDGKPLQKQLVCAYIPGYRIKKEEFKSIPVGNNPGQTNCFVGWRTYVKDEIPKRAAGEQGNSVCVNPLTWTTSEEWAPRELHLGIMLDFKNVIPNTVSATIEPATNILWVDLPPQIQESLENRKDLHIYDFNLFWMNIRRNVKLRIDNWLKENNTR